MEFGGNILNTSSQVHSGQGTHGRDNLRAVNWMELGGDSGATKVSKCGLTQRLKGYYVLHGKNALKLVTVGFPKGAFV